MLESSLKKKIVNMNNSGKYHKKDNVPVDEAEVEAVIDEELLTELDS